MINLIGQAIGNYHHTGDDTHISTFIDEEQDSDMPPSLFFRTLNRMNYLERAALKMCRGKVLDVGAAAGCHSLILQKKGMDVTALEISDRACAVMKDRGIAHIVNTDICEHSGNYNTILLLMNGFGLARTKAELLPFILNIKKMLLPGGQIIGDSTDIRYHNPSILNQQKNYYGEVNFKLRYRELEENFKWLYADENLLRETAAQAGLHFEMITRNSRNAFLVRIYL